MACQTGFAFWSFFKNQIGILYVKKVNTENVSTEVTKIWTLL